MEEHKEAIDQVTIFCSYAPEDKLLQQQLERHLSSLNRRGLISILSSHKIMLGLDREQILRQYLNSSSIILLLISPAFLASDVCHTEMQQALQRHEQGEARVIPVYLRPVDWDLEPFAYLGCLPSNGKPVVQWTNRDRAFKEIVQELRTIINVAVPLTSSNNSAISRSLKEQSRSSNRRTVKPKVRDRARQQMIERVRSIWITGLFLKSLYQEVLITLGLQERRDLVANPWQLAVQEIDLSVRLLPQEATIVQAYDSVQDGLLILGEPGSGKTTLLLELTRELLQRAEQDEDYPIPVIFTLSAWTGNQRPLTSWLVEELKGKYDISPKQGNAWLENGRLLLLLDGLDEVKQEYRLACIEAINEYRAEHNLVPIVVCSRQAEYQELNARARLRSAVVVQPLTTQQIDGYLSNAGEQLASLRTAIHNDVVLQELVTTPLMLNILMLTYQGMPVEEEILEGDLAAQRQQLFAAYVQRMFKRRKVDPRYSFQQTERWLAWLAKQMAAHNQTEFYIEQMQPDWLPEDHTRRIYRVTAGLFFGFFIALTEFLVVSLVYGYLLGTVVAIFTVMLFGAIGFLKEQALAVISPVEVLEWSGKRVWNGSMRAARNGCIGGLSFGLLLVVAASLTVPGSVSSLLREAPGLLFKFVFLFIAVLGFIGGLVGGMLGMTFDGFLTKNLDNQQRIKPNLGIWRSARNACIVGFMCCGCLLALLLFCVIGYLLFHVPIVTPFPSKNFLLVLLIPSFSILFALFYGGIDCLQHLILRIVFWRWDYTPEPLKYVDFLDFAVERILLRKVGGGYIFIHRFLLDYFVSLNR